jgi:hypothetical protein
LKTLTNKATEVFNKLINANTTKIQNNNTFMAVHIEEIATCSHGKIWSLAHYYEQNGDLMADPEMTFLVKNNHLEIYPLSYTLHSLGIYNDAVIFDNGEPKQYYRKMQADLAVFANMWLKNIKDQQEL